MRIGAKLKVRATAASPFPASFPKLETEVVALATPEDRSAGGNAAQVRLGATLGEKPSAQCPTPALP